MSHRRRASAASYLPTDGYLDPRQLTYALADGARRRRLPDPHAHPRDRRSTSSDGRVRGVHDRPGRRSRPRSSSTPAACSRPRSRGWSACACRSSRWRTSTSSPSRSASAPASHLPTLRDPDLLVYFREEVGGLVMGGYERDGAPWSLRRRRPRRDPAGLQRPAARGGLGPLRGDRRQRAAGACRRWRTSTRHAAHQRARGVHARRRVLPRRDARCAASSSPPASARTGWPAPAASARSMAEWIVGRRAGAGPVAHGHPALRRALPLARATR